jgi:hypothetical protein
MATSPNYGWLEPDNTDLVKNGALAIRTLGNAIDTTMATMVPKSIVDAKGDLIAGTAADTAARLAVGNNGETLVADSSTSTGLRYTAGTVQSNPVLNSAFQVWQRGTSFSYATPSALTYTADRYVITRNTSTALTVSRQSTNDTTNLPNIQYCMRVARNSGDTTTNSIYLSYSQESINSIPYAGKTVTFSFYARAGANYSPSSSILNFKLKSGTGTDQSVNAGYTGETTPTDQNATLTTTWQRFTYTASFPSTMTELGFYFTFVPTGTAGANDYFEITGIQMDMGSVALPFRTYAGTIQGELSACLRYFQTLQFCPALKGIATTDVQTSVQLSPMRTSPTAAVNGVLTITNDTTADYTQSSGNVVLQQFNSNGIRFKIGNFTGLTSGNVYAMYNASTTTNRIELSAEL